MAAHRKLVSPLPLRPTPATHPIRRILRPWMQPSPQAILPHVSITHHLLESLYLQAPAFHKLPDTSMPNLLAEVPPHPDHPFYLQANPSCSTVWPLCWWQYIPSHCGQLPHYSPENHPPAPSFIIWTSSMLNSELGILYALARRSGCVGEQ